MPLLTGALCQFAYTLLTDRHKYPLNMGLLTVWTLVESYTVGVVCASYSAQGAGDIVLQAFIITGVIFFGTCPAMRGSPAPQVTFCNRK